MKKIKQKLLSWTIKFLNFIFATITIALVIIAIFRPSLVVAFITWLDIAVIRQIWPWNYLVAFLSSTIESFPVIGVLVPGMQVMLLVGWFFWKHNLPWVIVVAIVWAIIGNYFWYFLWVKYWDSFFKQYWDWFWLGKTELRILKKQIDKNGPWFLILGKFHNFTRAFVPFIAGSMWMKNNHFWTYNIIGSVIWAFTIITLWIAFAEYYKVIVDNMKFVILWIFIIISSYIAIFKRKEFWEYIREKNSEIDEKIAESEKNKNT
jgi:membrane protein DedA with SNARE-associated domain